MPGSREEKRKDLRFKAAFETLYSADRIEGAGVVADISYSGALLSETSLRPKIGASMRLYVFLQPVSPVELQGRVIRHTDDGFAIEMDETDAELRRLVDDIGALVSVSRRR